MQLYSLSLVLQLKYHHWYSLWCSLWFRCSVLDNFFKNLPITCLRYQVFITFFKKWTMKFNWILTEFSRPLRIHLFAWCIWFEYKESCILWLQNSVYYEYRLFFQQLTALFWIKYWFFFVFLTHCAKNSF